MDSIKLLSGKELVENGAKKSNNALPIKGQKDIIATGTWLENKQVENGLEVKKKLLQDQRIEKRNVISHADWLVDLQKAHVTEKKGPYWSHIGHVQENKTYIFPEEALYLMEISALLLKFGGIFVSIQQAYTLLLGKAISLNEYRVYSALSKEGYKVIRHDDRKNYFNLSSENVTSKSKNPLSTKSENHNIEMGKSPAEIGLKYEQCSKGETARTNNELATTQSSPFESQNSKIIKSDTLCDSNGQSAESKSTIGTESINSICSENIIENPAITESNEPIINNLENINCDTNQFVKNIDDSVILLNNEKSSHDTDSLKRKNSSTSNEHVALKHKKYVADNISSDIIDLDDLPLCGRFKILDSMVDCYRKKIVLVDTPNKRFVPSNINLSRKHYFVNISNVSSTSNNFNKSISSNSNCTVNINSNSKSSNNSVEPYRRNVRYNGQNNNFQHNNYFSNNTPFFNHIYQLVSIKNANCNMHFERFSSFSNMNNVNMYQTIMPGFHNELTPTMFSYPFGRQFLSNQIYSSSVPENNSTSQTKTFSSKLNPNPFSATFSTIRNRRNRKLHNSNKLKQLEESQSRTDCGSKENEDMPSSSLTATEDRYTHLLSKIKNLLSKYDLTQVQNENIQNKFQALVTEYNLYFKSNFIVKQNTEKNHNLSNIENQKIVQLSSDSDMSIDSGSENSTILLDNKQPSQSSQLEQGNSSGLSHNVFNICSSDSNNCNISKDMTSKKILKSNNKNDARTDGNFHDWYKENGWNRPEIPTSKPKRNCHTLKLTMAFLNSVKLFCRDKESNVQSWKQAKQLYHSNNVENTVAISDDEDETPAMPSKTEMTIKTDSMEPLVRPQDCKSVSSVLKRLQIIKSYSNSKETTHQKNNINIKILYDTYKPKRKNFKKSLLPLPTYCIAILSHHLPLPSVEKLNEIRSRIPYEVKILYAVVSPDSIFFLQMENINSPVINENSE